MDSIAWGGQIRRLKVDDRVSLNYFIDVLIILVIVNTYITYNLRCFI